MARDQWEIDNVYVERARLQVKATRTSIADPRSTMEESRRILARSQELLRRIHQKESSAPDAGDNLHRERVRKAVLAHGPDHQDKTKAEAMAKEIGEGRADRRNHPEEEARTSPTKESRVGFV
jgi:uncharacterized protein with ATP-grasp and redox domains